MGFTKKTWLALALAIVLVFGLSITASAAITLNNVTPADGAAALTIKTGTAGNTVTIVSAHSAYASATDTGTIALSVGTSGAVKLSAGSSASQVVAASNSWTLEAVKPGTATITVSYPGATSVTKTVVVQPGSLKIVDASKADTTKLVANSVMGSVNFYVTDGVGNVLTSGVTVGGTASDVISASPAPFMLPSGQWTLYGNKPGTVTDFKASMATPSLDSTAVSVIVKPTEATISPFDLTDTTPYTFTGTTSGAGTPKTFILRDKALNPVAGAVITVNTSGILTPSTPTGSDGKFTLTPGSTYGTTTVTAKWGTDPDSVSVTSEKFTVLDPKKAQTLAITYAKDKIGGIVPLLPIEPADDAKGKMEFTSGDNIYTFKTVVGPTDAAKNAVTWTSSTTTVAKVLAREVYKTADPYVNNGTAAAPSNWYGGTVGAPVATADVGKAKYPDQVEVQILKAGTAKLVAKVDGVTRTLTFVVSNKAATAVTTIPAMSMVKNQYKQLKPTMEPAGAPGKFTYKSSKKTVATVNTNGVIKAVANGTSTITVKDSISGKSTSFTLTIAPDYSKMRFAGLVLADVGEQSTDTNVLDPIPWSNADFAYQVLRHATFNGEMAVSAGRGSYDPSLNQNVGVFYTFTKGYSATDGRFAKNKDGVVAAINAVKYTTGTDDDVFMFIFCGEVDAKGNMILTKSGLDSATADVTMSFDELATELAKVPGTVVVILDCNMSSMMLNSKGISAVSPANVNAMAINAFAKKNAQLKSKTLATNAATKDFQQKFKVITATSTKAQTAGRTVSEFKNEPDLAGNYTLTEHWLMEAFRTGLDVWPLTNMKADANKSEVVTTKELYNYIDKYVKANVAKAKKAGVTIKQTVAVYPAKGDSFPVYPRILKKTTFK